MGTGKRRGRPITSADEVRALLAYDHITGILRWKEDRRGGVKAGDIAGSVNNDGYVAISVFDRIYMAHRLIWLLQTGEWPCTPIDHANRDRTDNRWSNLRLATESGNCQNRGVSSRCKTGRKGVTFRARTNRYRVHITINGKKTHIGYFKSLDEAAHAYDAAAAKHHGQFNYRGGAMATSVVNGHRD